MLEIIDHATVRHGRKIKFLNFHQVLQRLDRNLLGGKQGNPNGLPMIVRADGTNNGAWFRFGQMWVQNEDVASGDEKQVESRSFIADLVGKSADESR